MRALSAPLRAPGPRNDRHPLTDRIDPSHTATGAHARETSCSLGAGDDRTIPDEITPGASFRLYMLERLRKRTHIRIALGIVYICASLVYLSWRATVFNPDAPIFSLIFYLSEILGFILACSMIAIAWQYRYRAFVAAPSGLKVDILIPTYNENVEMLRRTVLATMRIRYPHETWLLDDGNRPAVKAIADEIGCRYLARVKNTNAKPGNLNNALKYATGDFVAIMDADFVAQINFLDRLLGYFSDPGVAFVQCPQSYYNITAFQYRAENRDRYLWHDEGPFYDVLQPGRDYWNATSSCGTAVVYRRSAIDDIGGFAIETVTEDIHTAIRLHKRGYKSVYYPEPLAFGVAPNDLAEYSKTRHRWGQGNIQSLRCERVPFSRGLTLMQRLCYLQFGLLYLEGWQRLILYFAPPFILMTGLYPVGNTQLFFWFFVPYMLLDYLCFEETLRGYGRVYLNEQLCMSRFPIYIRATFAVFFDYAPWRVSSKKIVGDLPLHLLSPQIAVLLLNIAGLSFGINTIVNEQYPVVPAWITAFVCLFAAIYALLAALVIKEAAKRAKYKRPDFRFDVPLPVRIDSGISAPVYGVASSISTAGMTMTLTAAKSAAALRSPDVKGAIYLPNGAVDFTATIEAPGDVLRAQNTALRPGEIALLFHWKNQADKDHLDQTLHACGWHRRFVHPSGYLTTPIEWLEKKLMRRPPAAPAEKWKYVLYRRAQGANASRLVLGIVSLAGGTKLANRLIAFETIPVGCPLTVIDPAAGGFRDQDIVIVARGAQPDPSAVEIAGGAMINYNYEPKRDAELLRAVHSDDSKFISNETFA
jgi:cellulose synthase (UDP-forming)